MKPPACIEFKDPLVLVEGEILSFTLTLTLNDEPIYEGRAVFGACCDAGAVSAPEPCPWHGPHAGVDPVEDPSRTIIVEPIEAPTTPPPREPAEKPEKPPIREPEKVPARAEGR